MSSRLYRYIITTVEPRVPPRLIPLWNHPAGPKTIFFWSPLCKWVLVIAGLGDLTRPADKLSLFQSSALCVSGYIWTRYCFTIIPKNYSLAAVNFFVGIVGTYQLLRIYRYRSTDEYKLSIAMQSEQKEESK